MISLQAAYPGFWRPWRSLQIESKNIWVRCGCKLLFTLQKHLLQLTVGENIVDGDSKHSVAGYPVMPVRHSLEQRCFPSKMMAIGGINLFRHLNDFRKLSDHESYRSWPGHMAMLGLRKEAWVKTEFSWIGREKNDCITKLIKRAIFTRSYPFWPLSHASPGPPAKCAATASSFDVRLACLSSSMFISKSESQDQHSNLGLQ